MPPAAQLDPDRLRAANINPVTGLATDYLNHYNEVAMMLTTLSDMPDMADAILDWRPISYPAHFLRSGFGEKGLAIAAYVLASRDVKQSFRAACAVVESRIVAIQQQLSLRPDRTAELAIEAAAVFEQIARIAGIINGGKAARLLEQSAAQDLVDSLFA